MQDDKTTAPAVHVIDRRKKRQRTVSRPLRDVERMEFHLSRAAQRAARATAAGLDTYRERRGRSADKKRDGALRDLPRNAAEGLAATLRLASRLPIDLARAADTPTVRRAVYLGTRILLLPFRR